MAYCADTDLALGDIVLPTWLVKSQWIERAAEEIDSRLGFIYKVPLVSAGAPQTFAALATHEKALIKGINWKLATGRIILALDSGGEDVALHAYGRSLVLEAINDLMQVANGVVSFPDAALNVDSVTNGPNMTPSATNADEFSLVDAWSDTVIRGEPRRAYTGNVPPLQVFPAPSFYPRRPGG